MRRVWLTLILGLLAAIGPAGPGQAADFNILDLEGRWSLHAFGAYDVRGVFYFGTFDLAADGLIVGGTEGAYGWSEARFTGGGLSVGPDGEIGGVVEGTAQDRGPFWIAVKQGWMELSKNQITFIGTDDQEYQLLVTLVRVQD